MDEKNKTKTSTDHEKEVLAKTTELIGDLRELAGYLEGVADGLAAASRVQRLPAANRPLKIKT